MIFRWYWAIVNKTRVLFFLRVPNVCFLIDMVSMMRQQSFFDGDFYVSLCNDWNVSCRKPGSQSTELDHFRVKDELGNGMIDLTYSYAFGEYKYNVSENSLMSSVYRRPQGEIVVYFLVLLKIDSCSLSNEACNRSAISVLTAIKVCSKLLITSDMLAIFYLYRRSCCCKFLTIDFTCLLEISVSLLPTLKTFS